MYLVCGEALFDFFSQPDSSGQTNKLGFQAIAGGSPFNVAVGLRRLGVEAGFFAGISTDYLGKRLATVLKEEGVRDDFLIQVDAPTTLSMVAVGPDGSPQYSFRGEGCADRLLTIEQLPTLDANVRGLHVGSFSLVVQPVADALLTLVQRESNRRLITLDPNVRLNPAPSIDLWRGQVAKFAEHAHIIKVSDEDLHLLYPDADPETVAKGWLQHNCQLVIMTRGREGATVFTRNLGQWSVPSREVKTADTVGAGDTFQAALIAFLTERELDTPASLPTLSRETLTGMLEFAVAAAAVTCTRVGPDLPYRGEVI
ncbi:MULTISPECIES: carbohydrate kinase family protein [unclassified Pseudomonas]|uniref:carbohydrate kinase family protein n=1 Tax=unclassified Pseudomonas TaxID=196821 RepID=UPI0025EDF76E|nr:MULTISPECIES: carbohydrate kinase [unclassified Pseudomonas]